MMKNNSILKSLGFSPEEDEVYRVLIKAKSASISELGRLTGIHRPKLYKIIPVLIDKGLVSVMPKGKYKAYVAESPKKLEKIFESFEDDFNSEIHELNDAYATKSKKPIITYNEGSKAIADSFSDVVESLKKNEMYYRYSRCLNLTQRKYVPRDYRRIRDQKGLERLIITDEPSKKISKIKLGKTLKAVPKDFVLFDYNITQTIYGNKISLIDYNTKTVVTIENEMIAEFQKKIFKLLFSKL